MSNTFKIIYSTLVVVLVVNSFVFALPIVANAQATEKQQIEQIQLTATQKAELAKAEKEAKLAMYKELGLSTAEKKFVEKYTVKLDSFNQAIDKYVNYNKTNGNATVDVTAIYKNMKAIRTATGLTQNEVLTVKDIALKMVKNYNLRVSKINFSEQIKSNLNESLLQNATYRVSTKIVDRGVSAEASFSLGNSSKGTNTPSVYLPSPVCNDATMTIRSEWWGIWGNMNNCMVKTLTLVSGTIIPLIVGFVVKSIGVAGWIVSGMFSFLVYHYTNNLNETNRRCNYRGVSYAASWANILYPYIRGCPIN